MNNFRSSYNKIIDDFNSKSERSGQLQAAHPVHARTTEGRIRVKEREIDRGRTRKGNLLWWLL